MTKRKNPVHEVKMTEGKRKHPTAAGSSAKSRILSYLSNLK
jgi:hypothetical protein